MSGQQGRARRHAGMWKHPWQAVTMPLPVDADSEFLGWALWTAKEARESLDFSLMSCARLSLRRFFTAAPRRPQSEIRKSGLSWRLPVSSSWSSASPPCSIPAYDNNPRQTDDEARLEWLGVGGGFDETLVAPLTAAGAHPKPRRHRPG